MSQITVTVVTALPSKPYAEATIGAVIVALVDSGIAYADLYRMSNREVIRAYQKLYREGLKEDEIRRKSRA